MSGHPVPNRFADSSNVQCNDKLQYIAGSAFLHSQRNPHKALVKLKLTYPQKDRDVHTLFYLHLFPVAQEIGFPRNRKEWTRAKDERERNNQEISTGKILNHMLCL